MTFRGAWDRVCGMSNTNATKTMVSGEQVWVDGADWSVAINACGGGFICCLYSSDHETAMSQSASLTTEAGARRWASRTIARMESKS